MISFNTTKGDLALKRVGTDIKVIYNNKLITKFDICYLYDFIVDEIHLCKSNKFSIRRRKIEVDIIAEARNLLNLE